MTALQQSLSQGIPESLRRITSADALTCVVDLEVDARGLNCPMPLLKAKQGLRGMASGQILRVYASDSGSLRDMMSFCQMTGQELRAFAEIDNSFCYLIVKG